MQLLLILFTVLSSNLWAASSKTQCHISLDKYCGNIEFLVGPKQSASSDFKLTFYQKVKGKLVKKMPKQEVFIYLWMVMKSGHGHGSDNVEIINKKDHLVVKNVWFMMKGDWDMRFQLRDSKKKVQFEANYPLCIGSSKACKKTE